MRKNIVVSTATEWGNAGLPEVVRRAKKEAAGRLQSDSKVKSLVETLRKKKVDGKNLEKFIGTLPDIIEDWDRIQEMSIKKMREDSAKLAKKMRDLATEIGNYRAGRRYGPNMLMFGQIPFELNWSGWVDNSGLPESPSLERYLKHLADSLEAESNPEFTKISGVPREDKRKPFSGGLRVYAVKQVSEKLLELIPGRQYPEGKIKKRSPNKEIAVIVSVLLNLEDPITPNEVCQMRRKIRNKNTFG